MSAFHPQVRYQSFYIPPRCPDEEPPRFLMRGRQLHGLDPTYRGCTSRRRMDFCYLAAAAAFPRLVQVAHHCIADKTSTPHPLNPDCRSHAGPAKVRAGASYSTPMFESPAWMLPLANWSVVLRIFRLFLRIVSHGEKAEPVPELSNRVPLTSFRQ